MTLHLSGENTASTFRLEDNEAHSLLSLRRDSPLRPPDWRFRLAARIAGEPDHQRTVRARSWADDTVNVLMTLNGQALPAEHPLILARGLVESPRLRRLEAQARILAGQSDAEVGAAVGLGAEAIHWFASAYFDVRDRLDSQGYIVHAALGTFPPLGFTKGSVIEELPWMGYFYGPWAIDLLLEMVRDWGRRPRCRRNKTAAALSQRALRLRFRALIMSRQLPVGQLRSAELRALFLRDVEPNRRP